jgi:hypothetical protein
MKPLTFRRKSLFIVLSIFSTIAFTSCQKDIRLILKEIDSKHGKAVVFVAGTESNGEHSIAKCWIDGQEITLSDGTHDASANSVFVAGDDVYIAGNDAGPVYWKNFIEIRLPLKSNPANVVFNSNANSVYVSGNKVYIAGNDSSSAVYWKDGKEIVLNITTAQGNYPYATASSVFVSGNDVYVAGTHLYFAVYWKNGVEVYLTSSDIVFNGGETANSISGSGGNVYIVGDGDITGAISRLPRYWKNGVQEIFPSQSSFDFPSTNSVFASGNNVYVSGQAFSFPYFLYSAVYWTNGNETVLSSDGINSYTTSSIYVKGKDVYVSGAEETNQEGTDHQNFAVYWKNGTEVKLTDGTSYASTKSIFVK